MADMLVPILGSALNIITPLLFAACAGLFPRLAGTLNIALEGMLLAGAFFSLTVFYFTGSVILAVIAASAASFVLSALHALASFKLRANIYISGLAINILSAGLCVILSDSIFKTKGVVVSAFAARQNIVYIYFIFAIFLLFISGIVLYNTPFGYRLRACDKSEDALVSLGLKPQKYRIIACLISGLICGIGGSFLSVNLGSFVPNMSSGKGWIALVIIFLGGKKPVNLLIAAFIYSFAEAFAIHAQGFWKIPADFIHSFPYLLTLFALIIKGVWSLKSTNIS